LKVHEIMNKIVKSQSNTENWKSFINYEKYFGKVEFIRKTFKRAVEYCKEDKEYFSDLWISWEKL